MELNRLYLITDRNQTNGRPLVDVVKSALDGGVRFIQLREKDLSGKEFFCLAKELRELTSKYSAKLLINDRVDVALAVGADGVHLGRQSMTAQDVRRAVETFSPLAPRSSPLIVGVSTHSLEEALQAESDGADFITFGPVYFTPSKAAYGEPVGIGKLKEVMKAVNIPIFALGGITIANTEDIMKAGAYGVAMISAVMAANDAKKAVEELIMKIADHRPPATDNRL